jgi:hypothetical protein
MFWKTPYPETVYWLKILDPKYVQPTLSIGVVTSRKDHLGYEIIPTNEISIAVGDSSDLYKEIRNLPIKSARDIASRIIEMCDIAEKEPPHAS